MKTYGEACGVARALDVVGERWTLLVVRELLLGPKRFTDLEAGLPGVPSTLLGSRLRRLQDTGLISRRRLPPPAASLVYELTPKGRSLEDAVYALARWGVQHGRGSMPTDAMRPEWALIALRSVFRSELARELRATYVLRIAGSDLSVVVANGAMSVARDPVPRSDVVISVDHETLMALTASRASVQEALAGGDLRVEGEVAAAIDLFEALSGRAGQHSMRPIS